MFGPVITTEAHLAFAGAKTHSKNTAEMSAMIEALSFLGPHGPVARDMDSCIYYDSKHAAGVCLGTIQAQAHMFNWCLHVRGRRYAPNTGYGSHRCKHVYGHTGNLGNECADHAAALGSLGLISSHNIATPLVSS